MWQPTPTAPCSPSRSAATGWVDFVLSTLVNSGYLKIWVDTWFAGRR